ncbi:MAG: CAP domain-containing protein [Bacteroidetes bacterium]|nr:CAP domain-containing protein [Bacteroidota bacterium]
MKTSKILLAASLFALFFSCKKENSTTKTTQNPSSGNDVVYNLSKSTLLDLVNKVRQTGCTCGTTVMPAVGVVTWNDALAKAADDHSADMLSKNYFSHTGSDGSDPGMRIIAVGYIWQAYGENIALGYPNEQAVMDGWLKSEGHCKNIMSPDFLEMGAAREGDYWTQDFGKKQ